MGTLRKNIEKTLNPQGFRMRHDNPRHGYSLGTSLLSVPRLDSKGTPICKAILMGSGRERRSASGPIRRKAPEALRQKLAGCLDCCQGSLPSQFRDACPLLVSSLRISSSLGRHRQFPNPLQKQILPPAHVRLPARLGIPIGVVAAQAALRVVGPWSSSASMPCWCSQAERYPSRRIETPGVAGQGLPTAMPAG